MHKPTFSQLAQAHAAARLRGPLADAMRSPILARCLEITAQAMAQPRAGELRPPPAAPPNPSRLSAQLDQLKPLRRDIKRVCAGDEDE